MNKKPNTKTLLGEKKSVKTYGIQQKCKLEFWNTKYENLKHMFLPESLITDWSLF